MSNSPPTFVPFNLFGTTLQQTSDLLDAFFHWSEAGENLAETKARNVRTLIDSSTSAGTPQRQFWDTAFEKVTRWTQTSSNQEEEEEEDSFDLGLYPFTVAAFSNNRKPLEEVMGDWWTQNGSASKKLFPYPQTPSLNSARQSRSSSQASQEETAPYRRRSTRLDSLARSRSQSHAPDPSAATSSRAQTPRKGPLSSPRKKTAQRSSSPTSLSQRSASHLSHDTVAEIRAAFPQKTKPSPSKRRQLSLSSTPDLPFKRHSSLKLPQPTLGSEEEEDEEEGAENEALDASYKRRWKKKILESRILAIKNVPDHLFSTFMEIDRHRWTENETLVKDIAKAGSAFRIPLKTRVAMVKYQYVDLQEIYGFDKTNSARSKLGTDEDGNPTLDPVLSKKKIPNVVAWLDTWDTYSKYITFLHPKLKSDLEDYASWMRHQNSISLDIQWEAFSALDIYIRTNLCTDHHPATLMASTNDPITLLRFLNNPIYSSSDSSRNLKRSRYLDSTSNEVCLRFQDGRCPGEPGCRGRIHECENCKGDHAGQDCPGDQSVTRERLLKNTLKEKQRGSGVGSSSTGITRQARNLIEGPPQV